MKKTIIAILTIIMVCVSFMGAEAYMITSASDTSLLGGNVIDFEDATYGAFTSRTIDNVTFSTIGQEVGYIINDYAGEYNSIGRSLQNTYNSGAFNVLNIAFNAPVNAFGFRWGAADVQWVLTAFDASHNILDSCVLPPTYGSNAGEFFGLASYGMSYATLTSTGYGDYVFVDNFTTAPVPEPASMLLLGSGLVGLFGLRKKKED